MSFYVYVIRTDADLDAGYGPYASRVNAAAAAQRLEPQLARYEWFDGLGLGTREPLDALYSEAKR